MTVDRDDRLAMRLAACGGCMRQRVAEIVLAFHQKRPGKVKKLAERLLSELHREVEAAQADMERGGHLQ